MGEGGGSRPGGWECGAEHLAWLARSLGVDMRAPWRCLVQETSNFTTAFDVRDLHTSLSEAGSAFTSALTSLAGWMSDVATTITGGPIHRPLHRTFRGV